MVVSVMITSWRTMLQVLLCEILSLGDNVTSIGGEKDPF